MSVIDFALGLAGMPEKTIKDLDAAMPAIERLLALYKQAQPDIAAVLPVLQEVTAFIKQKES